MAARRSRPSEIRALAERAAAGFVRRDMAVNAMALAYRGLFALLVAVLSSLLADTLLVRLARQGLRVSRPWG